VASFVQFMEIPLHRVLPDCGLWLCVQFSIWCTSSSGRKRGSTQSAKYCARWPKRESGDRPLTSTFHFRGWFGEGSNSCVRLTKFERYPVVILVGGAFDMRTYY